MYDSEIFSLEFRLCTVHNGVQLWMIRLVACNDWQPYLGATLHKQDNAVIIRLMR